MLRDFAMEVLAAWRLSQLQIDLDSYLTHWISSQATSTLLLALAEIGLLTNDNFFFSSIHFCLS